MEMDDSNKGMINKFQEVVDQCAPLIGTEKDTRKQKLKEEFEREMGDYHKLADMLEEEGFFVQDSEDDEEENDKKEE